MLSVLWLGGPRVMGIFWLGSPKCSGYLGVCFLKGAGYPGLGGCKEMGQPTPRATKASAQDGLVQVGPALAEPIPSKAATQNASSCMFWFCTRVL